MEKILSKWHFDSCFIWKWALQSTSIMSYFHLSSNASQLIPMLPRKIPDKTNSIKEAFILLHSSRAQSIMAGKVGGEAAGHTASTGKEQSNECVCLAHCLLYIQSGTLAHGMEPPTLRVEVFLPQLTSSK